MAMIAMATQMPGWRLKSSQPPAIQVQPWPAGTGCPSAMKFCCGVMADPPWLLLLQSYSHGGNRLGHQRAVLVLCLALDEDHAAAVLQHAGLGEQPRPAAAADEGGAQVDGDHPQGVRMKRARRGAQRDVEKRQDDAAVDGADAVGEMGLDRQREPRASLAERLGEDLQVRDEGDALLVVAREGEPGVAGHITLAPPSTAIACPVMWREASEASSTTSPFRSSLFPRRLVGVQSRISSPVVPSVAWVIFEGKKPGQMALTVMPCCPHSAARARVKFTRPHFAGIIDFLPRIWVSTNAAVRLRFISLSQASSGCSSAGAPQVAPALLTRMSTLPNFFRISSATGAMASRFPMSHTKEAAAMPCFSNCFVACSSSSFLRAVIASLAPISPSASAICNPSPREPPVTRATRPFRLRRSGTFIP